MGFWIKFIGNKSMKEYLEEKIQGKHNVGYCSCCANRFFEKNSSFYINNS